MKFNQEIVEKTLEEAYELRVHNLTKSIALTEKALALSRENCLYSLTAKSLSRLALYRMIRGENDEALLMCNEAIEIYTSLDDERGVAIAKYSMAGLYYKSNNYHLGIVYLLDCLGSFKKFKDYHNESRTLKSLGTIYEFLNDIVNARLVYENAIIAAQNAKDLNLESNVYNPMSGMFLKLKDSVTAMELIKKSIELKTITNDQRGLGFAIYGRGKVHMFNGDYIKAEADFLNASAIHDSFEEKLGKSMVSHKLTKLWIKMGRREEATLFLKKVITDEGPNNSLFIYSKLTKLLSQIYADDGDAEKALFYLKSYLDRKNETKNSQTLQVIDNYRRAALIKTSEKEARLELERRRFLETKNRAEHTEIIKRDFLSVMSHEIRTPLNAVTTIISLLENRSSKEDQQLLTSLRFSSKNLLRIINDILDFSKLDSNKMELDLHPVNFKNLIGNIKSTYDPMAKEKGLVLNMDLSPHIAKAYMMDETKIFQILGNLLSNAVKFTDTGIVTISIGLSPKTATSHILHFKIADTGVGIAPRDIEHLFESFYIPKAATTRDVGGTGLGLAIVKRIVALHGGNIEVKSEVGEGSIFSFNIEVECTREVKSQTQNFIQILKGKTALLAEDNEINALVMHKLLEKYGISISRAKDGEEALKLSHEKKFDFVLMDIHMPKLNGYESCKIIKTQDNKNRLTPIFALTADINAVYNAEYTAFFDGFISKPLEVERLLAEFKRVLGYKIDD